VADKTGITVEGLNLYPYRYSGTKGQQRWLLMSERKQPGPREKVDLAFGIPLPIRFEIRQFKMGFQVWADGAPASDYLPTLNAAAQELKLSDVEERLDPSKPSPRWGIAGLKKAGAWSRED
jgi:hypothetical protein